MKIAFIILAHNEPVFLIRIVDKLRAQGGLIVIHFDKNGSPADLALITEHFSSDAQVVILSEIRGAWGKWSLVDAELRCLREIRTLGWEPDYVHLMSGSEYPIKSLATLENFLEENSNLDFIESVDISRHSWVQGGLEIERFQYHFPFCYRYPTAQFTACLEIQKLFNLKRTPPYWIQPRLGSQWWTLRWKTCSHFLDYLKDHPKVSKYFKTTLIPDESFFQSLVSHLIPKEEIAQTQLVFHHLCKNTRPYVFKNGHEELVGKLPHFFIRKISTEATELLEHIDGLNTGRTPSSEELVQAAKSARASIDSYFQLTDDTPWIDAKNTPTVNLSELPQIILLAHEVGANLTEIKESVSDLEGIEYLGGIFSNSDEGCRFSRLLKLNRETYVDDHWVCFFSNVLKFYEGIKFVVITVTPEDEYLPDQIIHKHKEFIPLILKGSCNLLRHKKIRDLLSSNKDATFINTTKLSSPDICEAIKNIII